MLPTSSFRSDASKCGQAATLAHKVRKITRIASAPMWACALLAGFMGVTSLGCAAETHDGAGEAVEAQVVTGTSEAKIFGGTRDDDEEAVAGVVALRVGLGNTFELCTGALIAPNVVLTARHCVTKNATTSVSCDENGHSANGAHVTDDEDVSSIGVYAGASPSFAKAPLSVARAIIAPSGPYLCDSDIALVVLATPIKDIAPMTVRMHQPARTGEHVRAIGYGQNDKSSPIGTRFRKPGVEVLAQGKGVSPSKTPLGPHEFEVGKSICQGDSGGPAISEDTGAIIGVVSRGSGCDDEYGHIYTTTSGFDTLFAEAFALAGGSPHLEAGDVASNGPSTRSKSSGLSTAADDDTNASTASCAAGSRGLAGGASSAGIFGMAAVVAAVVARRRRSV